MSEKLRTVRLYGQLGSKFGRVFKLAVNNPREAVRALCALLPGFEAYIMNASSRGVVFSVFVGKDNITADQLEYPVGSADIRIAPIVRGSKRAGVLQTIIGIILIVVGVFTSAYGGGYLVSAGVSMVIGGVVQMLTPVPKGAGARDSVNNAANYTFNGPVNTQAQGNPVPLLYGRLIVGSAVISAGIHNFGVYVPNYGSGGSVGPKPPPVVRDDGSDLHP